MDECDHLFVVITSFILFPNEVVTILRSATNISVHQPRALSSSLNPGNSHLSSKAAGHGYEANGHEATLTAYRSSQLH